MEGVGAGVRYEFHDTVEDGEIVVLDDKPYDMSTPATAPTARSAWSGPTSDGRWRCSTISLWVAWVTRLAGCSLIAADGYRVSVLDDERQATAV